MPSPHEFDPRSLPPLLTCPDCYQRMRIDSIEVVNGRERITLVCDDCRTKATQHIEYDL